MSVLEMMLHDMGDKSAPKGRRFAAAFCLLVGGCLLAASTFCFMNGFIVVLDSYGWLASFVYSIVVTAFYILTYLTIRIKD